MTELQQCFNYVKSLQAQYKTSNLEFLVDSNEQLKLHYNLGKHFYVHLSLYRLGISTVNALTKEEQEKMEQQYEFQFIQRNYGFPICVALDYKWQVPSLALLQEWSEKILSKENLPPNPLPQILISPTNTSLTAGESYEFKISASGYQLSYQWFKDSNPIEYQNRDYYFIQSPTGSDSGNYYIKVLSVFGNKDSNPFQVQVI